MRTSEELRSVAGLIIPGGESTTMALVAEQWGLIPELRTFASEGRPVWGTCAGMIFLAERAEGAVVWPWPAHPTPLLSTLTRTRTPVPSQGPVPTPQQLWLWPHTLRTLHT